MNYALDLTRQLNPLFGVAVNGHFFYRFNGNDKMGKFHEESGASLQQ